jgi:hypothetical protein
MDSVQDTLAGGFPHSEILGSKLVCRLPEAYRGLPRPSSPVAAKAFTMCAYSLDHITPKRRDRMDWCYVNATIPRSNASSHAFDSPYFFTSRIVKERVQLSVRGQKTFNERRTRRMSCVFCESGGADRDRTGDP